jgi:type I restriction enzyme R subunit
MDEYIYDFADNWGMDGQLLRESVAAYTYSQPTVVPHMDELTKSIVLDKAKIQSGGDRLWHIMELTRKLPTWMAETKQRYD